MRDLGKPWFSWTDLRAIVTRAYTDPSMELYRKLNPDWRFAEPSAFLLSEIASIVSSHRYLQVLQMCQGDDNAVPQTFWPTRYGPVVDGDEKVEDTSAEKIEMARQVADEFRAEIAA